MDKTEKQNLLDEYAEKLQVTLNELENKIEESIGLCEIDHDDINNEDISNIKLICIDDIEKEYDVELSPTLMTPQDIVRAYHMKEGTIKFAMTDVVGLDHISNKYLEIIELEKEECRKALGEDNKEFFKLL